MELGHHQGVTVYHNVEGSLGRMLEGVLSGRPVIAGLGPLYQTDPAADRLAPFVKSAERTGWEVAESEGLAPAWVLEEARKERWNAAEDVLKDANLIEVSEWSRAGVVLELGSRWGINLRGKGKVHPAPKLRASITERLGYEGVMVGGKKWNPLTIPEEERSFVIPSDYGRKIAVIDFRGIDVCSMISIAPGLQDRYGEIDDPHVRTSELLLGRFPTAAERAAVKEETFVYAYGGETALLKLFEEMIPELKFFRSMDPGEAGRLVQKRSAKSFRAALSNALPALISTECRPMYSVHDELVLDILDGHEQRAMEVLHLMEEGATKSSGVNHKAGITWGRDYGEAKAK